jgi:hypothetical protein
MGSKVQRQNQYLRRLEMKRARHERRGLKTDGLDREIAFLTGDKERPKMKTGREADPRFKRRSSLASSAEDS